MDFRTYLELETALTRRLQKSWRGMSAPIYAEITEACQAKQWDKARQLVGKLNMSQVGAENREYIRYALMALAVFGAGMTEAEEPKFLEDPEHAQILDQTTSNVLQYLQHGATADVQERALQLIADAQAVPVKKSESDEVLDSMYPAFAHGLSPNSNKEHFQQLTETLRALVVADLQQYSYSVERPYVVVDKNDKWKLTSGLQKSIRRGNIEDAHRLGAACLKADSWYTWGRVNTVALEDIGMGDLTAVAKVLAVTSDKALKEEFGAEKVLAYLSEQLAKAVKDRTNDDVFCIGEYGAKADHLQLANMISTHSDSELADIALTPGSVVARSLAMQKLHTRCRESEDFTEYARAVDGLNLPPLAQWVSLMASYKRQDGMASIFPLTAHLAVQSSTRAVRKNNVRASGTVTDLPGYALDMFTRTGRSSYAYLSKSSQSIRKFFDEHQVTSRAEAIGFAVFTAEGGLLDRQVVWDHSAKLESMVDEQEFRTVGLSLERGRELELLVKSDRELLLKARTRVAQRELEEAEAKRKPVEKLQKAEEPKQPEQTAFKFGSTQVNIEGPSEMSTELERLRDSIPDADLAGKKKVIGGNHVTVRYGIQSGDVDGIREYLEAQSPFPMVLGKVVVFPASEHSEGACPVVVEILSHDLHRMNQELPEHGDFKTADYDYKPHATLAYVKPEVAEKYALMPVNGRQYWTQAVTISSKDKSQEKVWLQGPDTQLMPYAAQKDDMTSSALDAGGRLNPEQSEAEPDPKRRKHAQKADTPRFVKPFVSFADQGDPQLQLIASLNASRLATYGFTAEATIRSIRDYKLVAILDGRTSPFCRMINGRTFKVIDARTKILQVLSVQNPDDLRMVQPWPNQSKGSIEELSKLDPSELVERGFHIPPFHPCCRTLVVGVGVEVRTGKPVVLAVNQVVPPQISTQITFNELGMNPTQSQVDHWNSYVGVSPVQVLSKMSGMTPQQVLESKLKNLISFAPNGDISATASGLFDGTKFKAGATLDPYSGRFYLDQTQFRAGNAAAEKEFLSRLFGTMVDLGSSIGASSVVVAVSEDAAAYVKMGLLPSPIQWQTIRMNALDSVQSGEMQPMYRSLNQEQRSQLSALLNSNNESALQAIVELPWSFEGKTVGEWILQGVTGNFSLNLTDAAAVSQAQEYLSADEIDESPSE